MSSTLTAEQIQRMEENRLKALAKKNTLKNINNENKNPVQITPKQSIFNNLSTHTTSKPAAKTNPFITKPKSTDSLPSIKDKIANNNTLSHNSFRFTRCIHSAKFKFCN